MKIFDAANLGEELLAKHNLKKDGWRIGFGRGKTYCGQCRFRTKEIILSIPFTVHNDAKEVYDTIIHEIAHAMAGRGAGHGQKWKRIAISLGHHGNRVHAQENLVHPPAKWRVVCPNGHQGFAHRKTKHVRSCGKCSNVFDRRYLLTYVLNTNRIVAPAEI